jgi:hypothetical protein
VLSTIHANVVFAQQPIISNNRAAAFHIRSNGYALHRIAGSTLTSEPAHSNVEAGTGCPLGMTPVSEWLKNSVIVCHMD